MPERAEHERPGLVTLYYGGHPYWARDTRYWLRSKADGFVYASSDVLSELEAQVNEHLYVEDRHAD